MTKLGMNKMTPILIGVLLGLLGLYSASAGYQVGKDIAINKKN